MYDDDRFLAMTHENHGQRDDAHSSRDVFFSGGEGLSASSYHSCFSCLLWLPFCLR